MLFRAGTVGISSMDRRYLFLFTYVPRSTVDRNQIQNLFGTKWGRVTEREQGTCSRDRRIYTIRFSCQEWISPASTQGGRTPYPSNSDPHSSRTSSTRRNTTSQRFRYSSAFGNHHRFATPVCLEIKDELAVCGRTSEERGQGGHGFLVQKYFGIPSHVEDKGELTCLQKMYQCSWNDPMLLPTMSEIYEEVC